MQIDLTLIAERLRAASERVRAYEVTASATDLIVSKDGHGTGRSESVPLTALFLRQEDVLGEALDRLERASSSAG